MAFFTSRHNCQCPDRHIHRHTGQSKHGTRASVSVQQSSKTGHIAVAPSEHDGLQSPVEGTPPCRTSSVLDDAIAEEIEEQPVVPGSELPSSAFETRGHKSGRVAPHEELQDEVAP